MYKGKSRCLFGKFWKKSLKKVYRRQTETAEELPPKGKKDHKNLRPQPEFNHRFRG